jgi:hypothetical protein
MVMDERDGQLVPYHVVPGPSAPRRILLISYHAPPSNEVGAVRWAGMARYFAARGWGIDFVAADPSGLRTPNEALLASLPSGTRLFGVPHTAPALDRIVRRAVSARRQLRETTAGRSMPSAEAPIAPASRRRSPARKALNAFHAWREYVAAGRWARRAAEVGRQIFSPDMHRWVISSGPPHMAHEGGRLLASWTGLPFIADFRDPWRFMEPDWVELGPMWLRLAAKYEKRAVKSSTLTITNVEPVRSIMQRAYAGTRIITITNGVDEGAVRSLGTPRKFIVGYTGAIYLGRDPAPLFEAVGMLVRDLGLDPQDLGLEFMGFFDANVHARLQKLAATHGLEPFLAVHRGQPRPKALEFMASCTILVTLQQGADLMIPAKVFEGMRFPTWLLVLAGSRSATAELLEGTGADVLDPHDISGIYAALTARFLEFKRGIRPAPLMEQERFTRRYQAERLMDAMEEEVPTPTTQARPARE